MYKFLFLMDPYDTLNLETETSLLLMDELKERGHHVCWIEPHDLHLAQDQVVGTVRPVVSTSPFQLGGAQEQMLAEFDCLLIRNDPPFDRNYFHMTLILDFLPPRVIQINPAKALRDFNEKIAALALPRFSPTSLTTRDWREMFRFVEKEGHIVIKPLDECSGRGIQKLSVNDSSLEEKIKVLMGEGKNAVYMTAQTFLPAVYEGDKRLFLVDGECVGMVNRIPRKGSFMGNIHQGARCEVTTLTAREEELVGELAAYLKSREIFMAGVDIIGGTITEINVTSPSAVRQINEVTGEQVEKRIVDKILNNIERERSKVVMKSAKAAMAVLRSKGAGSPPAKVLTPFSA